MTAILLPDLALQFFESMKSKEHRDPAEFCAEEVRLTTGPAKGTLMQPWAWQKLILREIWKDEWKFVWMTGGVQTSKTILGLACDVLYALFELEEDVGLAAPNIELAQTVYRDKIEPTILATRYKDYVPKKGAGSKGGKANVIRFMNGSRLYFFGAGGGDEQRSSHTVRIMVLTEIDKMDQAGDVSRETDPVSQLEARTTTFGDRAKFVGECTVSIEEGRIWKEITGGTDSKIMMQCRHCKKYIWPERKQFAGWEDAETVLEAMDNGAYVCQECGVMWSEEDRLWSIDHVALAHKGQTVRKSGKVIGPIPKTNSLGIRWTALHSPLNSMKDVARREWLYKQFERDEDEKYLSQFIWATPYEPDVEDSGITANLVQTRLSHHPQGIVPPNCELLTAGIDVGKRACYWTVDAWCQDATNYTIDYGVLEVHNTEVGVEEGVDLAILNALLRWRDDNLREPYRTINGTDVPLSIALIDSHWHPDPVREFCIQTGLTIFHPSMGMGQGHGMSPYRAIAKRSKDKRPGFHYYQLRQIHNKTRFYQYMLDVDHWKRFVHDRFLTPPGHPGCSLIFGEDRKKHFSFAKHMVSEVETQEFVQGKGVVRKWNRISKNNHYFDAKVLNAAGAAIKGVRLLSDSADATSADTTEATGGRTLSEMLRGRR